MPQGEDGNNMRLRAWYLFGQETLWGLDRCKALLKLDSANQ